MRVLLVDFNVSVLNRSVDVLRAAWLSVGTVVLYGPGHVEPEVWQRGVRDFIRRNGPFDVTVATDLVAATQIANVPPAAHATRMNEVYECRFDPFVAIESSHRNYSEFMEVQGPRVLSMLDFDSYNMRDEHRDLLEKADCHIVAWGPDLTSLLASRPEASAEKFFASANDNWFEFACANRRRIVSTVTAVSPLEFNWTPLRDRPKLWSVPGARYASRQRARQVLRRAGYRPTGSGPINAISAIIRVKEGLLRNPALMQALNFNWDQTLRRTRYAYTCGSGFGLPIRKFFEIPASGALLVSKPPYGATNLGFRHNENYIAAEPTELPELTAALAADPEFAQSIASAGRKHVWREHRLESRASQLRASLEAIVDHDFQGAEWINGSFVVHTLRGGRS